MRAHAFVIFSFFAIGVFSFGMPVQMLAYDAQTDGIEGGTEGEDATFQITDSNYLNIGLTSSEVIKLRLESVPHIITMMLEPAAASVTSTQITITGLVASTTYYKYEDSYHTLALVLTDENGSYSYTQDISRPHIVFIQPNRSTKFIGNDATGGDCASLGTWDLATLTCTLTTDLTETTQIDSDGITLDGGGHTTTGVGTGNGIYINGKSHVTIKNLTIKNFSNGIFLNASSQNVLSGNSFSNLLGTGIFSNGGSSFTTIQSNTFQNVSRAGIFFSANGDTLSDNTINVDVKSLDSYQGISFYNSHANTIASSTFSNLNQALLLNKSSYDNTITSNTFSNSKDSLFLYDSYGNTITSNTISDSNRALFLFNSHDNTVAQNTFSSSTEALFVYDSSYGNTMYHNNFLRNGTNVMDYSGMNNAFSLSKPDGGNYWDTFSTLEGGCTDADLDGLCDAPYDFFGGQDTLPWMTQNGWGDAPIAHISNHSSVLFLPGIESSRLYRPNYNGGTDKLWEPNIDSDVQDLYMNPDGTSIRSDVYTKERDVLDELPDGENIYKSFIGKMNGLKTNGTIADWEPIAYDWRLSLDDILNYGHDVQGRIYYSGELSGTSTPYIIQELRRLAKSSKTNKVTIVAHSNGGLLAKRLTEVLGPTESAKLIDKMIFVAVPQAGTPTAIAAGLHGYDQEHVFGLITSKNTARTLASAAPMTYQLFPSASYFTYVDNPVITFDSSLTDWISQYGETIHSQDRLHTFLIDTFGRVDPQTGDINQPVQFDDALLLDAESLHEDLDKWTPPTGVQLTQIAGWGIPKTVDGIIYKKKGTGVTPEADLTVDGDGTVIVPSALWTSTTTGAVNYWMNLGTYNERHPFSSGFGWATFDHSRILETDPVLNFISDQITNAIKSLSDYVYLSTEAPANSGKRLRYTLHSPLTLNLYDAIGHHTGISTTTGQVEEQIPGTYYMEFGDVKYIFSDASTDGNVIMNGYDSGTFTFSVDEYSGDTLTTSTTFKDIPTTASTTVTLDVQSGGSTFSSMMVDENGDGKNDFTLTPRVGEVVTYDQAVPVPEPVHVPTPQKVSSPGSISIPYIAPPVAIVAPIEAIIAPTSTLEVATSSLEATAIPVRSIRLAIETAPLHAPIKKSTVLKKEEIIPQTASVYSVSPQSALKKLGEAVYNSLSGIWAALKKFF